MAERDAATTARHELKNFGAPDEVRAFPKGRLELTSDFSSAAAR
jgi:hypothetical protein